MRKLLTGLFLFAVADQVLADDLSVLTMLSNAGIAVIPILGLSVLALAVTFERFRNCRRETIAPGGLLERIESLWKAGQFAEIEQTLKDEHSLLARLLAYLTAHRQQGFAVVSSGAGDLASLALREHLQRIYPLAVAATVAPIIGLLGTVIGMIESFHVIAFSGAMGDPALLAGGISKALVNTATGLSVALPSLAMHHFFKNRIASYGLELERTMNRVIGEWFLSAENGHNASLKVVSHAH